jgi:methyl coenzyme M reductase beta subunit
MKRKVIKAWITKHALTQGIYSVKAEVCLDISDKMISTMESGGVMQQCFHKPDWHESWLAAVVRAEDMRKKKIASIKKQIKKLEDLKFVEAKA